MRNAVYSCVVLCLGIGPGSSIGCKADSDCAHGACESHDACEGAWLCSDGCCLQVCNADADCDFPCTASDRSGEICESGLCVPGCRADDDELGAADSDCAHGACESSSACEGGWLCSDGCCWQVCNVDEDCGLPCTASDRSGEICESGLCVPGCREDVPEIALIDGNGPENRDSDQATSAHCLVNGLVVEGSHFDGARVLITGPGLSETVLAVAEGRTATHLEACLPPNLGPGAYTLSLANQYGSACGDFQLVQGPQGDEGPAGTYAAGAGIVIGSGTIRADIGTSADQVAGGEALAALEATVAELETTVAGQQTTVAELQATVTGLQPKVAWLETTVIGLQPKVAWLETTVAELQTTVAELQTTVAELQATVAALQTTVDAQQAEVDGLKDPTCPLQYTHNTSRTDILLCTRGADEMVKVGDFWVDRYEAHIVNADAYNSGTCDGTSGDPTAYGEYGHDYPGTFPDNGNLASPADKLYACSVPGVAPSRHMTWFQAQQACTASGKHLITNVEWQAAAAGTYDPGSFDGSAYPGCNTSSGAGVPRLTASAASTPGAAGSCISIHGVEDMVGNLWEWTAAWYVAGQHYTGAPTGWEDGHRATSLWPDASYGDDGSWNVAGRSWSGAAWVTGLPSAAIRGGDWDEGTDGGVFAVYLNLGPSYSGAAVGARCALWR